MKRITILICLMLTAAYCNAQYAPQAGITGSTAISASSGLFTGWATQCTLQRGYLDIAQPGLGYVSAGDSSMATGMADHSIVSLGDSGVATLTFAAPIINGTGADFAVFENGFANPADPSQAFLELAFVEVSSDGLHYVRFPSASNTQDTAQIAAAGMYMDASLINNLAGKYIGGYGTPFDLQELADSANLDINNITHVRIVDVIGSIGAHASYDAAGHVINDPYPSAFATGGFDLDAVGVLHQKNTSVNTVANGQRVSVYPNPATDAVMVTGTHNGTVRATLMDCTGKTMQQYSWTGNRHSITISQYAKGVYYLVINDGGGQWTEKVIKL